MPAVVVGMIIIHENTQFPTAAPDIPVSISSGQDFLLNSYNMIYSLSL